MSEELHELLASNEYCREAYGALHMQVALAKDGWPKRFVAIGPNPEFLRQLIRDSGRSIELHHIEPGVEGSSAFTGEANFVFIDVGDDYGLNKYMMEAWWPKIRISGWIGGHSMNMPEVYRAVVDVFPAQYEQPDPMLRVVRIGHSWLVPKFASVIAWPFNPNYFK